MKDRKEHTYKINGRVTDESGRGLAGLRVEAWDKDLIFDDFVGSDETDAEGRFRLEFDRSHYRELFLDREPDLFFKVFDGQELIESTRDTVLWNTGVGETPIEIAVRWAVASPGGRGGAEVSYAVEGVVASPDSAGVGGLRVVVVDRNVGQDVTLAETLTDERGRYRAGFAAAALRGKARPDLQARVFAGPTFLAASEVRYDAARAETLNVRLPAKAAALPSEYETLTRAIAAHFGGRPGDLQETAERQDITYLAHKTGWDARAVALVALADQFSRHGAADDGGPAIKPAFYYALFRAGLPANPDTLYQADARSVAGVLERAAAQGVIPAATRQEVAAAAEAFRRLGAQKLLTAPPPAGTSSMREMLAASGLDDAQQMQFADLYASHRDDLPKFWGVVGETLGADTAERLQVDGKLAFLTINNAPLMSGLRQAAGDVSDPVELAQKGFHRPARWGELLEGVPVPKEIPGDTPEARRANYADYLAAHVRLSYPTASVAEMVRSGDLPVSAAEQVGEFLTEHQGRFEIGMTPVRQYLARRGLDADAGTVAQVERLQRVYQITPTDEAMGGLLKNGLDAAARVVRHDRDAFVRNYAGDLGGAQRAAQTYDNSVRVYNAVLNIAVSYLTARNGIALGAASAPSQQLMLEVSPGARPELGRGRVLEPRPRGPRAENAGDVIAYPTLEGLFGEMDFCACDHCRSILSPAAYLADLLFYLDQDPEEGGENPLTVLLERRPDVAHLPLTCENTNTALPYIDVVNEALEYFIANKVKAFSLDDYVGHDTGVAASEDLLASPQFVMDAAYATLREARFPAPLPFHQPLESLRRHFEKFEVRLPQAMERLRRAESLERGANEYGWRDILAEELRLSRAEYRILTNSPAAISLAALYGFPASETQAGAVEKLSNAKEFSRRVGVSYEDLVAILKTRFVNPNSELLPKLERLGVPFVALKALKDGVPMNPPFKDRLPKGASAPDPAQYGGDIEAWVKQPENYERIMAIITLVDTTGGDDPCSFDSLEFRYSKPMAGLGDTSTRLGPAEFVRLLRFIRLWKKLGWTVEQTDAAICALMPVPPFPLGADAIDTVVELDAGFRVLLPRLGGVVRVMEALKLTPGRDLLPLLACWSPIGTHGASALYRQMFLDPALLAQDAAFADNGFGQFLTDGTQKLLDHAEALRSAFNLTGEEFDRIVAALFPAAGDPPVHGAGAALNLANVSAIHRRGWLARKLKISVRELLALMRFTGLDPFAAPDIATQPAAPAPPVPPEPPILQLVSLVQALRERSLQPAAALYLIWNQDLSGKAAPAPEEVAGFARTLRLALASVEAEFAVKDDPDGAITQARMATVYGADAAAFFFGLLGDTLSAEVGFGDPDTTLAPGPLREAIMAAAGATEAGVPKLAYDDFRKLLSYSGLLTETRRDAIKAAAGPGAGPFKAAVDALSQKSRDAVTPFFARYPELRPLYDAYVASAAPLAVRRKQLLDGMLPELVKRRKAQQALQSVSEAAQTDLDLARALLDPPGDDWPLHAARSDARPALDDFLALEQAGLSVRFFAGSNVAGPPIPSGETAEGLDFAPAPGNPLPANPTPGAPISGVWSGYLEAPESGFFNLRVEADAGASVGLRLGGQAVALTQSATVWSNTAPLELRAGTLYSFELTVEGVRNVVRAQWEWTPQGHGREVIPPRHLYPAAAFDSFVESYVRFLKAASLAAGLGLSAGELSRFAADADYGIGGDNWLNALAVAGDPAPAAAAALLRPVRALLDFARLKAELSPGDESLLSVLRDPAAATADADALLFTLTRWDRASLGDLLTHFGGGVAGLSDFALFRRVYDAFGLLRPMGIPAAALIRATTNEPTGDTVRGLQAALRARYDAADWRQVVRPINDAMRGLQRDALVAHILHRMRSHPATAHLDTPEKLFEYFLMDVQMEPCMQTSRIRHALSSVQLFIERGLMNLEPRVSPASLDAKRWEWMKRYRVWEANRKVFLFPENWLEPELRDDKSPFFKELESELLQSDITEDSAAAALLDYLSKLEEVAKLEPCGIFHVEADPDQDKGEVDYVVARTAGTPRKYYFRRRSGGSWSPWEQIKLDIEDNPVLPVVWRGRVFLFWLRILMKTPVNPTSQPSSPGPAGKVADLSLSDIKTHAVNTSMSNARVSVQAVLCWSEYYNGKWQPTKTSDVNRPTELAKFDSASDFNRSGVRLDSYEEGPDKNLRIEIVGEGYSTFLLYNTYGRPEREEDISHEVGEMFIGERQLITFDANFRAEFYDFDHGTTIRRRILRNKMKDRTVETAHQLNDIWVAPFFYEDANHVFFVTTETEPVPVGRHPGYGVTPGISSTGPELTIPPLVIPHLPLEEFDPKRGGPIGPDPVIYGPDLISRFATEDILVGRGAVGGAVQYGDKLIGPGGALSFDGNVARKTTGKI